VPLFSAKNSFARQWRKNKWLERLYYKESGKDKEAVMTGIA
jgi:hypothetical protein